MIFSDRQLSKIYLDVCEAVTGKRRDSIRKEYERRGLDTKSLKDLVVYIKGKDIIKEGIKEEIKELPKDDKQSKLEELRVKIANIGGLETPKVEMSKVEVTIPQYKKPEYDVYDDWASPINS
jgi:hypothetical protein